MCESKMTGLFIGRFQPFTTAHKRIIDFMARTHDKCVVLLVRGKNTQRMKHNPFGLELQMCMLIDILPENCSVVVVPNGYIPDFIDASDDSEFVVYSGSDRAAEYIRMLNFIADDKKAYVKLIPRDDNDVSATDARAAIRLNDKQRFKGLVPECLYVYWDQLKESIDVRVKV